MPELPEVETVVRDLRPLLIGQRIGAVHVSKKKLRRPWRKQWHNQLLGATVEASCIAATTSRMLNNGV